MLVLALELELVLELVLVLVLVSVLLLSARGGDILRRARPRAAGLRRAGG